MSRASWATFTSTIRKKARYVDEKICAPAAASAPKSAPCSKVPERVQPGPGQPPRDLHSLCAGRSEGGRHRPRALHACSRPASAACAPRSAPRAPSTTTQKDEIHGARSTARSSSPPASSPSSLEQVRRVRLHPVQGRGHLSGIRAPDERRRPHRAARCCAPPTASIPTTIVFVQCVGSRCASCADKGKPYCSKICCMYTAKHAMLVRDKYPDTEVYVFYIDVRTPGKNFDEFYRRAVEEYGVDYIKGMVGKVSPRGRQAEGAGLRPAGQRAAAHRRRHGGAGRGHRAGSQSARAARPPC